MKFVGDMLEIARENKDKEILILIKTDNRKIIIPMENSYYIIDNTVIFEIPSKIQAIAFIRRFTGKDFIETMEDECVTDGDSWGTLYTSPMEDLGSCELVVGYNVSGEQNDLIDNNKNANVTWDNEWKYLEIEDITVSDTDITVVLA